MLKRYLNCNMYKSNIVLIFILPIICRSLAEEISSVKAKTPAGECGLRKGGVIVQTVTQPYSSLRGLFWVESRGLLLSVLTSDKTTCAYRLKDGHLFRLKVTEIEFQTMVGIIPIQKAKRKHILITDKNLYIYTLSGPVENATYTLQFYRTVARNGEKIIQAHADTNGRLWLSLLVDNADHGLLLRVNLLENKTDVMDSKYTNTDFTWCKSNTGLYVADGDQNVIRSYAYDGASGNISDMQIDFDMTVQGKGKLAGHVSSIVKDTDGKAWIGFWNSGTVMQYDLDKKTILRTISIPAEYITSLAFGGKDNAHLFVGTKRSAGDPPADLQSGSIFAISGTGARGLRGNMVAVPKEMYT